MSKHNETGVKGERMAEKFLQEKGYITLHRNWNAAKKEIDLVMQKNDTVVFVEVKTRTRTDFGFPEEAVSRRKQHFLFAAAAAYLEAHPQYRKIQFDVVSVLLEHDELNEIVHFEDAFY